jgi:hypothetical protein
MKLLINYLTDDRRHYTFPHFINLLNISNKKYDWVLLILTNSNDNNFYEDELKKVKVADLKYIIKEYNRHCDTGVKIKGYGKMNRAELKLVVEHIWNNYL